jgi:iron complex transport system substrate-binding protein
MCIILLLIASCSAPESKELSMRSPRRIISIVPSVTETLFAMGLADNVIAVGDFDRFPPEVEKKPKIGGLINPNLERILALHPDLVITYGSQDLLSQRLQSAGIRVFPYTHGNVEETLRFTLDLGHRVGAEERAQRLVGDIRRIFDDVRAHAPPNRPKILLVHDRHAGTLGSFYSIGSRAFQDDLIEIAGGQNLFADVNSETLQPGLEDVISRKPDIILETLPPPLDPEEAAQRRKDWERLGLAKNRIYVEGESYLLVPGPRFGLAAQRISEIVRGVRLAPDPRQPNAGYRPDRP